MVLQQMSMTWYVSIAERLDMLVQNVLFQKMRSPQRFSENYSPGNVKTVLILEKAEEEIVEEVKVVVADTAEVPVTVIMILTSRNLNCQPKSRQESSKSSIKRRRRP